MMAAARTHPDPIAMGEAQAWAMQLPTGVDSTDRLAEWGQKRLARFRIIPDGAGLVAGGIFQKRLPQSLRAFQQLMSRNLKNWGIERENEHCRGWLRLCNIHEFKNLLLGARLPSAGPI
eukprot:14919198-Alexandrium_andersonii.AAC.1